MRYPQAPSRKTALVGMVLCLVVGYGLAACGRSAPPPTAADKAQLTTNELRATITKVVLDADRRQQMLTIVDQSAQDLAVGSTELEQLLVEQDRINRSYATTPAQLEEIGTRIQATRDMYRTRIIHARTALAQLATDDEWAHIIHHDHTVLGN